MKRMKDIEKDIGMLLDDSAPMGPIPEMTEEEKEKDRTVWKEFADKYLK